MGMLPDLQRLGNDFSCICNNNCKIALL